MDNTAFARQSGGIYDRREPQVDKPANTHNVILIILTMGVMLMAGVAAYFIMQHAKRDEYDVDVDIVLPPGPGAVPGTQASGASAANVGTHVATTGSNMPPKTNTLRLGELNYQPRVAAPEMDALEQRLKDTISSNVATYVAQQNQPNTTSDDIQSNLGEQIDLDNLGSDMPVADVDTIVQQGSSNANDIFQRLHHVPGAPTSMRDYLSRSAPRVEGIAQQYNSPILKNLRREPRDDADRVRLMVENIINFIRNNEHMAPKDEEAIAAVIGHDELERLIRVYGS